MKTWISRLAALFQKLRLERELDRDIQEHLQFATEENLRRGMSPREAAEAARRSFGGPEQMKEEFRDQQGIPILETLARETRFALRSLGRTPGFTLLAILTLALGIGANSAIFSAVNVLLFSPAGISEPGRVVVLRSNYDKLNLKNLVISFSDFEDVKASTEIFSAVAIAKSGDYTYTGGAYPQRLAALHVSQRWFEVLGVYLAQGRVFTAEEDRPNNNHVALLSHAAWQRVFGGDPSIVGKTIELDRALYRVIGIMRPESATSANEFGGLSGESRDLFIPLAARGQMRFIETYLGVARLQTGITFDKARAFMEILTNRGFQLPGAGAPRKENGWRLSVSRYTDYVSGDLKTPILILWGAVGFVLLIACSNIAGLTLARASARSRELAVRIALGGTRWHLMRQMLAESAVVAIGGSMLGLAVAYAFLRGVEVLGPQYIAGGLKIPFDLTVLLFTAGVGIVSGVLFGVAPAWRLGRGSNSEALKEGGRSGTAGRDRVRLRSILVIAEVALALVLSIGAGLLLRSLARLQRVDLGFRTDGVMSAAVNLPEARYKEPERQLPLFFRAAIQRLAALPGVTSAAAAYPLPFSGAFEGRAFTIVGRPVRENEPAITGNLRLVTPQFFSTLGIPLKRGRSFTEQDSPETERVTIIDETLAQQHWPGEDPLGQHIQQPGGVPSKIVGIVGHTKESDLASRSDRGVFYYSFFQSPIAFATLIVRTDGRAGNLATEIQGAVNSIDPAQPIYDVKTMEERVSATLAGRRFTVLLLGLFAGASVFLAALGLYGVINYGVTQRTQEIGIRVALGARRAQVLSLIASQGMKITLIGLAVGWIVAFEMARMLPDQLFGVSAFDPVTFTGMATLLAAVTLLATYVPARRAMNLDPLEALQR